MLMTPEWLVVYFEFDTAAAWDKSTGGPNGKAAAVVDAFFEQSGLASWCFDYADGALITIDNE